MSAQVTLRRAIAADAEAIWRMQREAFADLLAKYGDDETNPAAEPLHRTEERLADPATHFYFIETGERIVGAIRVVEAEDGGRKRISPLFVLPACRGKGYARAAMIEAERSHGRGWELSTIEQEAGLCRLYEMLGYQRTGQVQPISDCMTLVFYEKD